MSNLINYLLINKKIYKDNTIEDLDNLKIFIKKYVIENNLMKKCLILTRKIIKEYINLSLYFDINIISIMNEHEYGFYWSPEKISDILDTCCNFIAIYLINIINKN